MRFLFVMLLSIGLNISYADNLANQQTINTLNNRLLSKASSYQNYALSLQNQVIQNQGYVNDYAKKLGNDGLSKLRQFNQIQATYAHNQAKEKPYHGLIIFASLGMPDSSLKALIKQADHYQVPIIIQGLYENSLAKTAKKLFQLIKPSKGQAYQGGIMIDPTWFRFYNIQKVPAFVVTEQLTPCDLEKGCKRKAYDILYGNISLSDALNVFKAKGSPELKPIVEEFIKRGNSHA